MARRGRWGGLARRALLCAAVVLLLAALGASGGYFWLQREFSTSGPATAGSLIQVDPGASLRGVLARLEATGTVRHARAVELYLRLRGLRPRVQAGNYEIPPHASPEEILALFEQGKVVLEQLTVVEGATFNDFLEALDQHPHVLHTLRGKSPVAIMGALGHPGVSPEGEFFPDTYRFPAHTGRLARTRVGARGRAAGGDPGAVLRGDRARRRRSSLLAHSGRA